MTVAQHSQVLTFPGKERSMDPATFTLKEHHTTQRAMCFMAGLADVTGHQREKELVILELMAFLAFGHDPQNQPHIAQA